MKPRPSKKAVLALAAGVAAIAAAAALAQESLLPPGFGTQPGPSNRPLQGATPAPGQPVAAPVPAPAAPTASLDLDPSIFAAATEDVPVEAPSELPDSARRSIDAVGPFAGFGRSAWGESDGRFLASLMRRLDVPTTSRWASITLRRALLTRVATPRDVAAPDWVAERAWLLLRMGEADGARMLVQGVDVDRFTPKMYAVATQTALATADVAAFCPLVNGAMAFSKERAWPLAQAMCAGLAGEQAISSSLINRAQGNAGKGIDLLLAEKVVGAGTNSRRAVNIEWASVDRLNAWRFGLASAVGLDIPEPLYATVGPQVQAWRARAPMLLASARLPSARKAAALGVLSSAALVDLYGAVGEETDEYGVESPAGRLRAAYVADDEESRLSAIRALWEEAKGREDRYAASVLTARAAVRIRPSVDHAGDAGNLIAAMFSAGLDRQAIRWAPIIGQASGSEADAGWAVLAVGAPRPVVDLSYGRIDDFNDRAGDEGRQKAGMLAAALAGLGRLSPRDQQRLSEDLEMPLALRNNWTRALDRAVAARQTGTVLLLAALGMQSHDWRSVSPAAFYHIISALHRAGLNGEARMIAAEAMTRL